MLTCHSIHPNLVEILSYSGAALLTQIIFSKTLTRPHLQRESRLTEAQETGEDEKVHIPGRECGVYDRPALICVRVCVSESGFVPC